MYYYPFGLTMSGITSKAAGKLEKKFKYNGNEEQRQEFCPCWSSFVTSDAWFYDPHLLHSCEAETKRPYSSFYAKDVSTAVGVPLFGENLSSLQQLRGACFPIGRLSPATPT
jgi:hypothetical protein